MFTGLVQATARVVSLEGGRLRMAAPQEDYQLGESVAVNGCCLTVVSADPWLEFDLSDETLRRTSFGALLPNTDVNLERALRVGDRLGGHFVSGHVDAVGKVESIEGQTFRFSTRTEFGRYLVDKGSVAIDGISLTVIEPEGGTFAVAVIPHTLANTNLWQRSEGDAVNLEFDMLAKYVERLISL